MGGISFLQLFTLFSIIMFLAVLIVRTVKILRTPLQLRWELMPIPHEKGRYYYGGSHFEETDYWKHEQQKSTLTELFAMGGEILLIKSLYERNRQLWWFSYPFHIGLYLLSGFFILLVGGALLQVFGANISPAGGFLGKAVHTLTVYIGPAGYILAAIGCSGLLLKRMTRRDLRTYSVPADYFNLIIILAVLILSILSWFFADRSFELLRGFLAGVFSFQPFAVGNPVMTAQITLTGLFLIYMPFTHMIHFMAKYFAYHHIRWADDPNTPGSNVEKKVLKQLGYKVTWSAPHIKSGGTWAEAATDIERPNNDKKE